jgi:8-oxo-dGTP diphosphatase
MEIVQVVAGIIYNSPTHFLIARRKMHKSHGGFWEFPGGKVEQHESLENALLREIREELNIDVCIENKLVDFQYEDYNRYLHFNCFECSTKNSFLILTDHDLFVWITLGELQNYSLAPADVKIASYILKK